MRGSLMAIGDDSAHAGADSARAREMAELPRESRLHQWTAQALGIDGIAASAAQQALHVTGDQADVGGAVYLADAMGLVARTVWNVDSC